ncbi:MAG: hypothetical protein V7705_07925 [Leeuwenhoekiella marinoflava]|uniref:DUF4177 domain-containing protein n=2 Tax=Leeuwenhoekiella marinoflava TaxID=988 RepID=A0A4Q0PMU7_9FLAO|nr:hypothetical protein [Leeuwenhoekiella marinoflava]RXG31753.1 hypothetical protein DSL99_1576 [Leeuwenhoekiella marinoflava]SHF06252.1 hypothetical protein SAMN02745246_01606 [Leeuwenhoekiella marinoflava DSM 3653]
MKISTRFFLFLMLVSAPVFSQVMEYQTVTVIESIIPNGIGRSRMISTLESRDYKEFTSTRSEEDDSRNTSDRGSIRLKNFEETKLLNFFNIGGIRFQNIAANDAVVTSKINEMAEEGWELAFVNSGVESYGGDGDDNGIYVTRYIFKRQKEQD